MCLNYQKLKMKPANDEIRIGYKYFKKLKDHSLIKGDYYVNDEDIGTWYYHNKYFDTRKKHSLGEWHSMDKNDGKLICVDSCNPAFKRKKYKAGFHFYTVSKESSGLAGSGYPSHFPATHQLTLANRSTVCVECICCNITATGKQSGRGAFVAQSYRLIREV